MFSGALLLLLAAGCVKCEQLNQPASVTVQPGQRLTITCQVSYSVRSYRSVWIRQPAGNGLEWVSSGHVGHATYVKESLKNKFSMDLDSSRNTLTLNGQNMQFEDSAVYFCARDLGYFDLWGKGTTVTVSSGSLPTPTLYPVVQCDSETGDEITVGCLSHNFVPTSTFQWTNVSGTSLTSVQYPATVQGNKSIGLSLVQVSKSDWKSGKSFRCSLTHPGGSQSVTLKVPMTSTPKLTLVLGQREDTKTLVCTIEVFSPKDLSVKWKKNGNEENNYIYWPPKSSGNKFSAVSVLNVNDADWDNKAVYTCEVMHRGISYTKKASKVSVTLLLSQPSPRELFINNEAKLECTVTGQDQTMVNEMKITWQIDEQIVTSNNISSKPRDGQPSKTSTLTKSLSEWNRVNKVRCSAERDKESPIIQDLTVQKGDGRAKPKVSIHSLPVEDINNGNEVTLMCLVSSPVQQDYYIAWSEDINQRASNYADGIDFPQQKTKDGYLATSVYIPPKEKWNSNYMFKCSVLSAGSNDRMESRGVSKVQGSSCECD